MFSKLKQFKDIRDKAKTIQQTLAQERIEGSAGWGKVVIIFDGNQKAVSVSIHPDLLSDKTKLESTIKDAINDGIEKVQKIMAGKLKEMGGLDLAQDVQDLMQK